ncbi:hypothetical protein Slin15195_G009940 [Septoria linicola]|uniref:Uncharacterized protein n=1 Tax=Septoria linicola TaxID=215465 RepID=A0A9Q9AEK8_9PEZI|nr:hypothetical protein Slin14017_G009950 [Septoria linicola]USW47675.1 hypothetical protein Slin15195_G009940 [Septoria linicola]
MAPAAVPALAQSESKTRFFQRLSLRDDSKGDKELYAAMKREAVDGRKRLIENESPTSPINETSTHAEILRIYQRASPETRAVYDLGKDTDGAEEENWIIRWLLWHCFRYRDQRNNRNRGGSTINGHNSGEEDESSGATSSTTPDNEAESSHASSSSNRRHDFWDPVRNSWQAQSP